MPVCLLPLGPAATRIRLPEAYIAVCRHNCLNCWERDLVKAIIIQPGHVCLLSTQSICLRDTNDCNLTAIEGDCNELVTVCLMWACCSKVGRIIKGMGLYFRWHYVQWQQWRLMRRRFISFSKLFSYLSHSCFSFVFPLIDSDYSLCIMSAEIIPFDAWWEGGWLWRRLMPPPLAVDVYRHI